jgi:RNA polymerase sigma-70 factor, ECF subfamily
MSAALAFAPPSALRALIEAAGRVALPSAVRAVGREAALVDEQDRTDVRAALDGDGPAFGRLVARHQQAVARHLSRFVRDAATREQLVQDTFVEAWQSLRGWSERSPLGAWLRTIAVRVGYRHWREQARGRELRDADDPRLAEALAQAAGPAPDPAPREAAELLAALLARLAPRDRLVLTLIYWEGCSVEEAARLTGWSRAMVKVQAFRARRRLEKLLPDGLRPEGRS